MADTKVSGFTESTLAALDSGAFILAAITDSGNRKIPKSNFAMTHVKNARSETSGTIALVENRYDVFGTITTATFTLTTVVDANIENEYHITFLSGGTASVITWPGGISWANGVIPTILANKKIEVSILDTSAILVQY